MILLCKKQAREVFQLVLPELTYNAIFSAHKFYVLMKVPYHHTRML